MMLVVAHGSMSLLLLADDAASHGDVDDDDDGDADMMGRLLCTVESHRNVAL